MIDAPKVATAYLLLEPYERKLVIPPPAKAGGVSRISPIPIPPGAEAPGVWAKSVKELTRDTWGKLDGDLSKLDRSWTVRELGNIVVRINKKFGARVIDRIPKRGNAGTTYRIKDEYFPLLREYITKDPLFAGADMKG